MPRSGRRLGQLSSKPACNQGKAKLTWMKQTHSDSREQTAKLSQNGTTGSAIEPGMDQRGLARSGLAGVKDAARLAAFFLKHHRSPSAQELEDHAWSGTAGCRYWMTGWIDTASSGTRVSYSLRRS